MTSERCSTDVVDGAKIVVRCVIQQDRDSRYVWLLVIISDIMSHETQLYYIHKS